MLGDYVFANRLPGLRQLPIESWELLDFLLISQLAGTFRRMTEDTLDSCHDLHIQAIHNTAWHIYLCFHTTIENVQLANADSVGGNVPTRWHFSLNLEYLHAFWSVCQMLVKPGMFRKLCTNGRKYKDSVAGPDLDYNSGSTNNCLNSWGGSCNVARTTFPLR
jgi:hypothetical protein